MMFKLRNILIVLSLVLVSLFVTTDIFLAKYNPKGSKSPNPTESREKPIVIWYHSGEQKNTLSLKTALSSGLITHVIIKYRNPSDDTWHSKKWVREAIEIVKKSEAKLVWGRDLWARWLVKDAKFADLFDSQYYIKQIHILRAEAKEMGADFVFLDTEPYGNSPMRPHMLIKDSVKKKKLSDQQHERLKLVIKKVIQRTGKIDFIAPAGFWGYPGHNHPWDVLAELGNLRIAENTYYDNARQRNAIKYPYEIFGAYVNATKRNDTSPHNPFFLSSEIFEKSHLWSHKKGLYLYSTTRKSLEVAQDLAAYSKTLPFRDSSKSREPSRR
jgi:hypothetical protein